MVKRAKKQLGRNGAGQRRYKQRGAGFFGNLFSSVNKFLKKHKVISRLGGIATASGLLPSWAKAPVLGATAVAKYGGYGRKRVVVGRGVKLAGAGTSLAGGARRRKRR